MRTPSSASGRRPRRLLAVAALGLALTACSSHNGHDPGLPAFTAATQDTKTGTAVPAGTSVQTFNAPDGSSVQYVLAVPPGRIAGQKGKVVLAFPPGNQDLATTQQMVTQLWQAEAAKRGWVVVAPVAGAAGLYSESKGGDLVSGLMDAVTKQFPPEDGRFDVAGVSNGGTSAFRAAIGQPSRVHSLVVFPGQPPQGASKTLSALTGIGTAMFVGAQDTEWLQGSKAAADTLRRLGNRVKYVEVPDQGHVLTITGADLFDAMEEVRG